MTLEQEIELSTSFKKLPLTYELWWFGGVELPLKVKTISKLDDEIGLCAILINGNYVSLPDTEISEFYVVCPFTLF
jgi:hypothetical protein